MNDLPLSSKLFRLILYADDITLFSALDYSLSLDISTSCELINRELSHVGELLKINRLSINISKTKYTIFHSRHKEISHVTLEPTLNGDKIERVKNHNFLGVVIDKHISWEYHTEMLSIKISKYCGVLSRLKNYLPLFILRTMYFSMVHSHLNYGLRGFDSKRIIKLQKRCFRIITRSTYNARYSWIQWNATINTNVTKYQIILPLSTYTNKAQLTITTPARGTISGQIECASISLKNVFGIICRRRQILFQIQF